MKILVIQNRMGIGDLVIFLPFIEAISKKFGQPVTCLVKKNSKADEILRGNTYVKELIFLERDGRKGNHEGIKGSLNLILKLRSYKFDKVFIFNSSLRFNLISKFSGIQEISQYPLFKKKKQHIILTAQNFLKKSLNLHIESNPIIKLDEKLIIKTKQKFNINKKKTNIIFGIGGS